MTAAVSNHAYFLALYELLSVRKCPHLTCPQLSSPRVES